MLKCEIWLLSHPIRQHDCACLLLMAFWFITVLPANPGGEILPGGTSAAHGP